ncbi:hypothetical protein D3C73_1109800 [compost metagenome]
MLDFVRAVEGNFGAKRRLLHRGNEAVTALRHIVDVALPVLPVTQCATQGRDVHAQVDVLDHRLRPHARNQLLLADDIAGLLDQHLQDVHGAAAHAQWPVALEDQPLAQMKGVGTKMQHGLVVRDTVHARSRRQTRSGSMTYRVRAPPCIRSPVSWQPSVTEQLP